MKIIAIIPARYASSRFPGKPLADICGKPMIWWVHNQVKQVKEFDSVFVATDDKRIADVCDSYGIKYLMTSNDTPNHIHRIWEVTNMVDADFYISINGDEPLISPENIRQVFPEKPCSQAYFGSVYRTLKDPAELLDIANVKIVLGEGGKCLYQSRNPIPCPKGSLFVEYKKAIGIECFNKAALDFFVHTPMGYLEKIEDIDHLRFIENGIPIIYKEIQSESLSVDTRNDLEKVRLIISNRMK
ncbi:3-deoxy-manno-octulosonate cytidylyltransferase [Phocaeicola barnesiae]|uniref:3-deoxy-manno-octulosonate cytidylyltransferase n=1 Tax=Phocaeicola barnesiae TaxID=376804 RepID=A0AAW5MXY3_9BACT|nr:3-deoxy-manno-octulosonate cytidylyltransferase [Phocaeicola barnesiae]MCR8872922.1 3-deoxy-manno-octulosonate cytidylyltransferase [Phocaeicola barnesiae]